MPLHSESDDLKGGNNAGVRSTRLDRRGFLEGLLACIPICGKAIIVQPQNNSCHTQTCLAHATNGVIRNSGSSQSPRDSYSTGFANIRHFAIPDPTAQPGCGLDDLANQSTPYRSTPCRRDPSLILACPILSRLVGSGSLHRRRLPMGPSQEGSL